MDRFVELINQINFIDHNNTDFDVLIVLMFGVSRSVVFVIMC